MIAFFVAMIVGLFVPPVELFMGPGNQVSLGRAPVWLAYLCVFEIDLWFVTLPIIVTHLLLSAGIAWLIDRTLMVIC